MPLRCRAKIACRIAGIKTERLNEWIKEGIYPCAPETEAGSARIFERDDVVVLMVFGQCINFKLQAARAGETAFLIRNMMKQYAQISSATLFWNSPSQWSVCRDDELPNNSPISTWRFDIKEMRKTVEAELEYERANQILGD